MGINAHVISELDPGAIPGGSTITRSLVLGGSGIYWGPISIDRRVKVKLSLGLGLRDRPNF